MNAIVRSQGPVQVLRPQNFNELVQFAQMAARSAMVPRDYIGKPENIMLAVQMGSELGLAPMQALANIAVINGRPSVWGDAMPGLCRQSPVCQDIEEWYEGDGDGLTAQCKATRVGAKPVLQSFSVEDAKKAGLWGKAGPWTQYPRRMLQQRARGFALRDAFPDVLRGLISAEEARDIPAETDSFTGTTLDAKAEPHVTEPVAEKKADPPKRRTISEFLDALEAELAAVETEEALDLIANSAGVAKAMDTFRNGALERLTTMLDAARERFVVAAEEGDGWPGPDPDGMRKVSEEAA